MKGSEPPAPGTATRLPAAYVALAVAVFACAAGLTSLRELEIGKAETAAADEAAAHEDWPVALAHARAAAEAFVPGSPWPERGMERLEGIARDAATRGDRGTAISAYGALRTASLATHVPGAPGGRWRSVADRGLARVSSLRADAAGASEATRAMQGALKDDGMPAGGAVAAIAASVLVMLVGLFNLLRVEWLSPQGWVARFLMGAGFALYAAALLLS
jgi:hypothetical protein